MTEETRVTGLQNGWRLNVVIYEAATNLLQEESLYLVTEYKGKFCM